MKSSVPCPAPAAVLLLALLGACVSIAPPPVTNKFFRLVREPIRTQSLLMLIRHLGLALLLSGPVSSSRAQDVPRTTNPLYTNMLNDLLKQTVPFVSVAELHAEGPTVLLDARAPREFAVSHLPGARWVGFEQFDLVRVQDLPRNTPIVVYCSVGYHSEKVGEQLQRAGYTHVRNLYGGLFEWLNEGFLPVTTRDQPTTRVHAYSRSWGAWLRRGQKVYD